jgi:outer membrane protein OmpA-like peptidoglycan-associated protein
MRITKLASLSLGLIGAFAQPSGAFEMTNSVDTDRIVFAPKIQKPSRMEVPEWRKWDLVLGEKANNGAFKVLSTIYGGKKTETAESKEPEPPKTKPVQLASNDRAIMPGKTVLDAPPVDTTELTRLPLALQMAAEIRTPVNLIVYFDDGASNIKPESMPVIEEFSKSAREAGQITVRGFTGFWRLTPEGTALAKARAASTAKALRSFGVNPHKMEVRYRGACCQIGDFTNEDGRSMNRRAEVNLVK